MRISPFIVASLFSIIAFLLLAARRWRRLAGREPRIILTGGGTGGHVNPALAIAEGIKTREPASKFLYVGVRGKAEGIIVRRAGYPIRFVASEGYPGLSPSPRLIRFLCRLGVGVVQAAWLLLRFAPRWIVATGGYVSAPIIIAALILQKLKIAPVRIFLHEQNSVPGQLNAFLGRWVDRVLLTFPQTHSFFSKKGALVGYPVRHAIVSGPREEALANLGFDIPEGRRVVFAFGGSQGARTINRAMVDALQHLLPYRDEIFIVHGMGLAGFDDYNAAEDTQRRLEANLTPEQRALLDGFYFRQDYFHNIEHVYSVSDLIVCRSGAGSLNEICRLGKPSLLIPKANLPGDHQVMNARAMKHVDAAEILFEDVTVEGGKMLEKVDGHVLAERIMGMLRDPARLAELSANCGRFLRRDSNERILSELYGDHCFENGLGPHCDPLRPLLGNRALLRTFENAWAKSPSGYDPVRVIGDGDDLNYYRRRAAGLLNHKQWQVRNTGVKLIGYTHYEEKIPALLHMLADRTPAPGIQRLFGGDFVQVGFIRRNILQALQVIGRFDDEVERHLLAAMDGDPYYEVRAQACRAVAHFAARLAGKDACMDVLLKCLKDRSFEVAAEAAKAIGEVGMNGRALRALLELKADFYWQVRDAGLKGVKRLIERRIIPPSRELLSELSTYILTATDFRPYFSIKETYRIINQHCIERLEAEEENPVRTISSMTAQSMAMKK